MIEIFSEGEVTICQNGLRHSIEFKNIVHEYLHYRGGFKMNDIRHISENIYKGDQQLP